jgi:ABC-type phosphate transport system permease subunit
MNRIFLSLAVVSTLMLMAAMGFGLWIENPAELEQQGMVARHQLLSFGGLIVALMVHGLVLTYFMGTGRWIEETSTTYGLGEKWRKENTALKYSTLPLMVGSVFLLITAGAFGAAADPASPVGFQGWLGLSAATWHFLVAVLALGLHLIATIVEYFALCRNGELIQEVMAEVQRIRAAHGLANAKEAHMAPP